MLPVLTCDSNFNVKWGLAHRVFGFDGVDGWVRPFWWGNNNLRHSLCIDDINPRRQWLIIFQPGDLGWRFSLETSMPDKWDKLWGIAMQSCHTDCGKLIIQKYDVAEMREWNPACGTDRKDRLKIYTKEEWLCMQTMILGLFIPHSKFWRVQNFLLWWQQSPLGLWNEVSLDGKNKTWNVDGDQFDK